MVISSVWLPSLLANVFRVLRSRNSSKEDFFAVLKCLHNFAALITRTLRLAKYKVGRKRKESYVAPMASLRKALKGPSFPP